MNPAELEILRTMFSAVPEEMGIALKRTAYSPNIKERMDASCAVFDASGRMVAQAEHIPVHLGSMPVTMSHFLAAFGGDLWDGDQLIANDPYRGGSHLPDITVAKPVFDRGRLIGFAVNRAHHADVGGAAPGSMPVGSRTLEEEGVVIVPSRWMAAGEENRHIREDLLGRMRDPRERLGDLRAQVAANELGARRLRQLHEKYGTTTCEAFAGEILAYSERRVRAALASAPKGTYRAEDALDDDGLRTSPIWIRCAVTIGDNVHVDFAGSDPQVEGNVNAPLAVTMSATYYVVRCLTDPGAPPNAGCYAPIRVSAPEGCVVNPRPPAAVAAGNVETSQRIVDALFLALAPAFPDRVPAQSQGTMNNLLIGGDSFAYYETIAGGEGALPYRAGMSGVHTHMTNTRNTPIEALELAYPMRVEEYRLIRGSGGAGRFPGGEGVRRSIRFLGDRGTLTIVSDRRTSPPKGLAGGADGARGRNLLIRDGHEEPLPSKVTREIRKDEVVVIETPGGGGWGPYK
ncbi:MAG TPA: hydantoinase B/oxoprolinase family protein [Thermoplasmata archaeon]|nr:hydantoinase B/oxoprolinase family protein [Thermoplasmata archaeon]